MARVASDNSGKCWQMLSNVTIAPIYLKIYLNILYICRIFLLSSLSIILYMHTALLSISQHLPQGTVTSEKKAYSLIFVLKQARAILCCRGDAYRSIITRFRDSRISETVLLPTPRLEFRISVQMTSFTTNHRELLTSCFSICTVPSPGRHCQQHHIL